MKNTPSIFVKIFARYYEFLEVVKLKKKQGNPFLFCMVSGKTFCTTDTLKRSRFPAIPRAPYFFLSS